MKFSSRFVQSIYLAVVSASIAAAAPAFEGALKHATTQVRGVPGSDLIVESYHPPSLFETFGVSGGDHSLSDRAEFNLKDAAVSFVQSRLGVDAGTIAHRTSYANDVAQHAYLQQQINNIPIANAIANIAFNKANKVVSFGSSFVKPSIVPSTTPSISADDAIAKAEKALSGTYNNHTTSLQFVAQKDGSLALAHVIQIQNNAKAQLYEAFIDAHSGELVQLTDFGADASYRVLPITKQNVTQGFQVLTDPQDRLASPFGWHSDGVNTTNNTSGNNANTWVGVSGNVTYQSAPHLTFNYVQDPSQQPQTYEPNVDAARVNAFYLVNTVHDITYRYGFTEDAFNFQYSNFGKGGAGGDQVYVSVQDSTGTNNARFVTPPEGQPPTMYMYLFTLTDPWRDGSLQNDIVVHENTHGLTNRMTGGGTAACLQTTESQGLGEGWSDAFAEWTEQTNDVVLDWVTGPYVLNNTAGVRHYPYSTNATTNPFRYGDLQTLTEVHDIGEVWANMLHNVYAGLVADHGFSPNAHTDPTTTGGNTVYLHLFIDALALQPCNPTFVQARDAWIQADANRYHGSNFCTLWAEFASRGLGVNAANYTDDTTVPAGCNATVAF
ncbi:Fungalysin metallopeptidase-domain-containing protein [Dichomitus squalens]|uniref:Extracellular metalloproteinase n=1 Tax=Dichomitus squalens TaxID=114155 RepID=A0A4Q9MLS0_9APHY|nr:Fungalysin metallopeptidase-domain-containing protein [Dichomitus squalens]